MKQVFAQAERNGKGMVLYIGYGRCDCVCMYVYVRVCVAISKILVCKRNRTILSMFQNFFANSETFRESRAYRLERPLMPLAHEQSLALATLCQMIGCSAAKLVQLTPRSYAVAKDRENSKKRSNTVDDFPIVDGASNDDVVVAPARKRRTTVDTAATNAQMQSLLNKMPSSVATLSSVSVAKVGDELLASPLRAHQLSGVQWMLAREAQRETNVVVGDCGE